ncbi:MAG: Polysaccharide biosynthesis protein [Candidatus Gottesmanbacteria bacterium GW2011_GWB1_43_11]|uniref:Polysaccharide biosynthesis protein n=1 Tax=Candidatus Gottesmanbacteria bacterium GW2011_GWB1_43_11 TaxID=1618446 RepID=A0A0G1CPU0_9BACT|nr:MAG: Polysaccharide biosynthesis protein [Candidatus Gottesmanbacteria bacterium GW2011_GWA2_42_16]KKS56295.1 MAG: Polysaccharide biosynthesis protein [Candidatus Gottesmanbacteria bacterium GW2011_GWA1_42_26]KKS82303.1 MAG: Polysaccharide biosynthesis protein [Candidatus Gottesmanbacteria bacterium GW2011_GWC1_43_10]KKS87497.1 MAG: Polysaccharide biosynthesis protein [Candidatus Gottesmanbacteria bacterium GW2011_GWB1_43_11]OGG10317.1 MAG: hypothetical protein A2699_00705 [Candidatus Gottes
MIKKIFRSAVNLGLSKTARSVYWVFTGNVFSIILTFFTTILIANHVTKAENGIFLALFTLANLLSDLGEAGLGSALSSFIPRLELEQKSNDARAYLGAAFRLELGIGIFLLITTTLFAGNLSHILFADTSPTNVVITSGLTLILVLFGFSTFALSAYKKFREVALMNIFYSLVRLGMLVAAVFLTKLSLFLILAIYLLASLLGWIYSLYFLGTKFIMTSGNRVQVKKLLGFSSFLGIQRIFISVSSRLDLLMLVPLAGAVQAGVYGIASRFALVYPLVIGSLGQVLAPKFAEFAKGRHALDFFRKVGLLIGLLLVSLIIFYIFAQPLMLMLVPKYADAIPVFKGLLIAMTGFIAATPFVSFLIYTLKKPQVMTFVSAVQLIIIFLSNLYFIPKLGRFGPAIGIGLGNLAVLVISVGATWYYLKKEI